MADPATDGSLLLQYAATGSEQAFHAVVERHTDLVYSAVLRRVTDAGVAKELTQNVFISLARKAARFRRASSLAGWCHSAAVLEARRWWRDELRRKRREQEVMEMSAIMRDTPPAGSGMSHLIDEGLLELGAGDRQAVILHFIENLSFRDTGAMMGVGEDAARKRAEKGLGQLTKFFRRKGYSLASAAGCASSLRASVVRAPPELARSASRAAVKAAAHRSIWDSLLARPSLLVRPVMVAALLLVLPFLVYWWPAAHSSDSTAQPGLLGQAAQGPATALTAGAAPPEPRARRVVQNPAAFPNAAPAIAPGEGGTILINNFAGGRLNAPIYGPERDDPSLARQGNTTEGLSPGSPTYSGEPLAGNRYTCQVWAAPGSDQPSESLQAGPKTTFRTGAAAGFLTPLVALLPNVPKDEPVVTVQLRVWDNQGGTVTNWSQAAALKSARGVSKPINVGPVGGDVNSPPFLEGLESFNIAH